MPTPEKENGVNLQLYYYPYSFYSQKVSMALHQMKIKYQPKFVDIHKGKQFSAPFLALNPKGEVPVLVDDVRVIPDSEKIIDYLEDNFGNGNASLLPQDRDLRARAIQLHQSLHSLKIEPLGFGAAIFDDLNIHPKAPYNCLTNRQQMRDYLQQRPRILEGEAAKHPLYADLLLKKLDEVQEESKVWRDRDNYEGLLIQFEKVLDECEAELASHENPNWWLCSPDISIADVDFCLILYRLWQLGFERRMWERNRPNIRRYYNKMQTLESFKKAISMSEGSPMMDFFTSPVVLGLLGSTVIIAGGYYLWTKKGAEISSALSSLFTDENENQMLGSANRIPSSRLPSYTSPRPTAAQMRGGTKPHQFM